MKHIKPYKIFENNQQPQHPGFPETEEEIHRLCKKYDITNYIINEDLTIDVDGDVYFSYEKLEYLPLKFNYVSGDFDCSENKLISLKGSPIIASGFTCSDNELQTLKYCPNKVESGFSCSENRLTSLEYYPSNISGGFYCENNPIYTLIKTFIYKDNTEQLVQEFNDYDIVRGDTVVLNRLEVFFSDFDLEMPNLDEVKEYYTIV